MHVAARKGSMPTMSALSRLAIVTDRLGIPHRPESPQRAQTLSPSPSTRNIPSNDVFAPDPTCARELSMPEEFSVLISGGEPGTESCTCVEV